MNDISGTPQHYEISAGGEMHPNVVAYRLGQVENKLTEFGTKLDLISQNYPTTITIELLLNPLRSAIKELEDDKKEDEKRKQNLSSQLRLALIIAILSPLFSIILTLLLTGKI